jgi:TonB family protein
MRRLALLTISCLATAPLLAQAPSAKDALKNLQKEIIGQPLILQGFSADPVTHFDWTPSRLTLAPPDLRTVGIFTPAKIKLRHDTLEITGGRHTYHLDQHGHPDFTADTSSLIEVDLHGADPSQVLPTLKSQLSYPTIEAAAAALPEDFRNSFRFEGEPRRKPKTSTSPGTCPAGGPTFERPKVLFAPDAEYSEDARRARFSGNVQVFLTVTEDGRPSDFWIVRGAGLGLDQQAGKAVSQYRFRPATCDGQPVKIVLFIEVNFQTF